MPPQRPRCQECEVGLHSVVRLVDVAKTFVGSRVRQLRSERGFSQAALAQMLEISPSYLNQIEHDVRPLTVAVLLRITEVFGVDATFFAGTSLKSNLIINIGYGDPEKLFPRNPRLDFEVIASFA